MRKHVRIITRTHARTHARRTVYVITAAASGLQNVCVHTHCVCTSDKYATVDDDDGGGGTAKVEHYFKLGSCAPRLGFDRPTEPAGHAPTLLVCLFTRRVRVRGRVLMVLIQRDVSK